MDFQPYAKLSLPLRKESNNLFKSHQTSNLKVRLSVMDSKCRPRLNFKLLRMQHLRYPKWIWLQESAALLWLFKKIQGCSSRVRRLTVFRYYACIACNGGTLNTICSIYYAICNIHEQYIFNLSSVLLFLVPLISFSRDVSAHGLLCKSQNPLDMPYFLLKFVLLFMGQPVYKNK